MSEKVVDQRVVDQVERDKWKRTLHTLAKDWRLYVLLIPMLAFVILLKYRPIGGILLGFRWNGDPNHILGGQWAGLRWAFDLFGDTQYAADFWRAFRNTFVNSMYGLLIGFPIPILIALLFSEIKCLGYRSFLQVACYLPHFVSTVVVTALITLWCEGETQSSAGGVLYQLCSLFNLTNGDAGQEVTTSLLVQPKFFRPIYQISGIWEGAGYGSIVYFAAIVAISPTSYEAARIDGASKLQQIRYVTLPGMAPTLTIMLINRIGSILNVGYEKVLLLIGDKKSAWETGDVISTLVYRMSGRDINATGEVVVQQIGIVADLFNAVIAMCLVLGANAISRRVSSTSLF